MKATKSFGIKFFQRKKIILSVFRMEDEIIVGLGSELQPGTPFAVLKTYDVWKEETKKKKFNSLLRFSWTPSEELLQTQARKVFYHDIFGNPSDYNEGLLQINHWHNSRKWDFTMLTREDIKRSEALDNLAILLSTSHRGGSSDFLHMHLFERMPQICTLLAPMVVKIPVTSLLYSVKIHAAFAFKEIRESGIEYADDIIAYIYEIQYVQLKTALSLHELLYLIDYNEKNKGEGLLLRAELSAITEAEAIIGYLKSSIEKLIILLGLIFKVKNLETKKTHKDKLRALYSGIPERIKGHFYFELIEEFIKSESIAELTNYRTGLFHKKGISKMQPHSFVGKEAKDVPLRDIIAFAMEQHTKNSLVTLALYAILTDELVYLKDPEIDVEDFFQLITLQAEFFLEK